MKLIECVRVSKRFGSRLVVDNICFDLVKGQNMCLMGYNGAGKTVLLNMLTGLILPTEGEIKFKGRNIESNLVGYRKLINFSSGYQSLQLQSSVWENLEVFAGIYGVFDIKSRLNDIYKLLDYDLSSIYKKKLWSLSSGERGRVTFIKSLLNKPELLFLDEPGAFVDVSFKKKMINLLEKIGRLWGTTVIISSHDYNNVVELVDRYLILKSGRNVFCDNKLDESMFIKLVDEK